MTTSITERQKGSYILVKFFYVVAGTPVNHRYTDWSSDVLNDEMLGGSTFTFSSNPDMQVSPIVLVGSLEEKTITIELTKDTFLERISNGAAHAKILVKVWEVIDSDAATGPTQIMLFRGRVAAAIRNYQGKSNRVQVECTAMRTRLNVALGMPAQHHCCNIFGDNSAETGVAGNMCRINVSTLTDTGSCTSVAGKTAVITGVTTPSAPVGTNYWQKGYAEYGGVRLQIRNWVNGTPTAFQFYGFVPVEWAGQTITLTPGCDHTITVCRARWNNEANFNGFGIKTPSYNPAFQRR